MNDDDPAPWSPRRQLASLIVLTVVAWALVAGLVAAVAWVVWVILRTVT